MNAVAISNKDMVYLHWHVDGKIPNCLGFSVISQAVTTSVFRASYNNDENMLILKGNRPVAQAYAAHVLAVYEHYRWRWKLQQPMRDALQKLKQKNPHAKSAELWNKVMSTVGKDVMKKAWQHLEPDDRWQDFYVEHKGFLAAETNFWSPFGGVSLTSGRPRNPTRRNR
jgi:hypothetical protein